MRLIDQHNMPTWPVVISMVGFGLLGLVTEVYWAVRHFKRSWRSV